MFLAGDRRIRHDKTRYYTTREYPGPDIMDGALGSWQFPKKALDIPSETDITLQILSIT